MNWDSYVENYAMKNRFLLFGDGSKDKLVLYGNCHMHPLGCVLSKVKSLTGNYDIYVVQSWIWHQKNMNVPAKRLTELLCSASWVFHQHTHIVPTHDCDLEGLSNVVSIPTCVLHGQYAVSMNGFRERAISEYKRLGDEFWDKADFSDLYGRRIQKSKERFFENDNSDISMQDYFFDSYRKHRVMVSKYHCSNRIVYELARRIAERMGFSGAIDLPKQENAFGSPNAVAHCRFDVRHNGLEYVTEEEVEEGDLAVRCMLTNGPIWNPGDIWKDFVARCRRHESV